MTDANSDDAGIARSMTTETSAHARETITQNTANTVEEIQQEAENAINRQVFLPGYMSSLTARAAGKNVLS